MLYNYGQSDRNHPSGAIPRTQQGSVQHDRSFTSYEDSGIHRSEEYSQTGSSSSSRSKICPSGHESITYNSSGQKTPSDDELISRYLEELEDETLKVGYFDVMIIYCEEDREKAEAYKDHLNNDIITKSGLGKSQIASYVPKTHFLPGQHKPIQHAPGQHLPIKNQPGQQHVMSQHPYPNKSGKQREIVEIHHHHHYTSPPEEADYKSSRKVVNVFGAKYVQIGKGGNVVSAEGGRTVEGDESDKDSSSDSEQQAPAKKGQR
ncbi:hypothetical protein KUTeg_018565 [Tegillarca granosa]|uniref:Uncharacterized protein n=1 Tax=Tegillarca granosa TaxID=220873 RepID=A0ABQ9EM30_TEGGR|nr:hypothetical protein KUTeg_018565 [Tegillarca granosa]